MNLHSKFQKGENVRIISTGKIGTINDIKERLNQFAYRVMIEGKVLIYQEKFLELFIDDEQEIMESIACMNFGTLRDYEIFQTWLRLNKPYEGNLYSYLNSKTIFNPFQFKPLLKFLSPQSMERLFIADEVGVGKTIESGIILTELLARKRVTYSKPVLIVCPNILGPKWQREMLERFNLSFRLHDRKSFRNALIGIKNGQLMQSDMFSIVSMQMLRSDDFLQLLMELDEAQQEAVWSFIIVDEAHHMRNSGTNSNQLGHLLSTLCEMMLMLSATPLNLKEADLFNLMNILNPYLYPDMQSFEALTEPVKCINQLKRNLIENNPVQSQQMLYLLTELNVLTGDRLMTHPSMQEFEQKLLQQEKFSPVEVAAYERLLNLFNPLDTSFTRTLKKDAFQQKITREVIKIPVVLTTEELLVYETVASLVEQQYILRGGNLAAIGFVTNLPRRMAVSCLPAMRSYVEECLAKNQIYMDVDMSLLSEDTADLDFDDLGDDSSLKETVLPISLRTQYEQLLEQFTEVKTDTKYEQFKLYIDRLLSTIENPQVIVFSFFIRTVDYLKERLEADGYTIGVITGKTPLESRNSRELGRYDIIEQFKMKRFQILLASDVGGEGLDFQFCQALINYDLPYNPMKIEQRIGRIDRFGQEAEKIFVASMYLAETVDERIYELLYERIDLVNKSIGMFEPILGRKLLDFQQDLIAGSLSGEQLKVRSENITLAIEKTKLELAQFEERRLELFGDDAFQGLINGIKEGNDFIKPSDAVHLTTYYLESQGIAYKLFGNEVVRFKMTEELIEDILQFTRKPGNEGNSTELLPLLKLETHMIQFNGSKLHGEQIFIPTTGYWVSFVLKQLEEQSQLYRTFSFVLKAEDIQLPVGTYCLPIFNIDMVGVRTEHHLAVVPVSMDTQESIITDYIQLARSFHHIEDELLQEEIIESDFFETVIEEGRYSLDVFFNEYVYHLQVENEAVVSTRIYSLERGLQVRLLRLEKMLDEHKLRNPFQQDSSIRYIRTVEGRIENERRRTEQKIKVLRANQQLTFSTNLVGAMLVTVKL